MQIFDTIDIQRRRSYTSSPAAIPGLSRRQERLASCHADTGGDGIVPTPRTRIAAPVRVRLYDVTVVDSGFGMDEAALRAAAAG